MYIASCVCIRFLGDLPPLRPFCSQTVNAVARSRSRPRATHTPFEDRRFKLNEGPSRDRSKCLVHPLEPRVLLALESTSRYFLDTLCGGDADEMWEMYIPANGIPPRLGGFTFRKWMSFLHHPCCMYYGATKVTHPGSNLRVRLCPPSRRAKLIEYELTILMSKLCLYTPLVRYHITIGALPHLTSKAFAAIKTKAQVDGRVKYSLQRALKLDSEEARADWNQWVKTYGD
ncbi:hypothetical protein RhiJN_16155 [Ceratobasidium sp. AG-Ba]|nr:hypothetical protein RhiJN_16155 [Ceratobasidium sp. AG-Ba]